MLEVLWGGRFTNTGKLKLIYWWPCVYNISTCLASFSRWLWTLVPEGPARWTTISSLAPQSYPGSRVTDTSSTYVQTIWWPLVFRLLLIYPVSSFSSFFLSSSLTPFSTAFFDLFTSYLHALITRCYTLPIANINPTASHIALTRITVSEQGSPNRTRSNSQLTIEDVFGKSAIIHSMHLAQPSQSPLR